MHRDIKPENLILRGDDSIELTLVDFGLAEYIDNKNRIFSRCGTPGYVAPEVLADYDYDGKCDVFSAGIICYIILTGCSAFSGQTYDEIIQANRNCDINWRFEKINISLSPTCIHFLRSLLEKDPVKRPSIKEVL